MGEHEEYVGLRRLGNATLRLCDHTKQERSYR